MVTPNAPATIKKRPGKMSVQNGKSTILKICSNGLIGILILLLTTLVISRLAHSYGLNWYGLVVAFVILAVVLFRRFSHHPDLR